MFPNKFRNIFGLFLASETTFSNLPKCSQMLSAQETYQFGFVKAPRKFIIAKLSNRKLGSYQCK